jgi:GAF domain-containing protein
MAASPGGDRDRQVAEEQAALRQMAVLVAQGKSPGEVFAAVAAEAGQVLHAEHAWIGRYHPDGTLGVVAAWASGDDLLIPVGTRISSGGRNLITLVFQTGGPARLDDYADASGAAGALVRELGFRATAGVPVSVEGRLWGLMGVASTLGPLPAGTEARLAGFTELAAIAIANAQAREELRSFAAEQEALRRVAVLVARGAPPEEVFAAVAEEAGQVLHAEHAYMGRYDPDGTLSAVAASSSTAAVLIPVGTRFSAGGRSLIALVFQTGRPARIDDYATATGATGTRIRESGIRGTVGAPVSVEDRLWGVLAVASTRGPLPAGTEARLAAFTELAATAIANAQAREELRSFAAEQAALRRVATLVAQGASSDELFSAVAEEVAGVIGIPVVGVHRYEGDGTFTMLGIAGETSFTRGSRWPVEPEGLAGQILATGRPTRRDDYSTMPGPLGDALREDQMVGTIGAPIMVDGSIWGFMVAGGRPGKPIPAGTEERLDRFIELVTTAIAQNREQEHRARLTAEQAALRRVAVLVACGAPPEEVFAAVAEEAARVLDTAVTTLARYDPDSAETVVGAWTGTSAAVPVPVGTRKALGERNVSTLVFETGRPARIDDYENYPGEAGKLARESGRRRSVGAPVSVEGRLWGVMIVTSTKGPLPADTEARLAGFTELAATAIANAEARAALTASRARIVAAADAARYRIERDLHDGAQQRLVSLGLQLRAAQAAAPAEAGELAERLEGAVTEVTGALEELREIARGLHPAVLAEGGLRPALRALARRSAVPVNLDVRVAGRLAEPAEIAAYYTVAEALTNAAKHARASAADVEVAADGGVLRVCVRDDGRGGADFGHGSGLVGLRDRVEALGGQIFLDSPRGAGTSLRVELPLTATKGGVTIPDPR